MSEETPVDTRALLEPTSIVLILEGIKDRAELRRLRKIRAIGMRGPDDITGSKTELFCPGGVQQQTPDGFFIPWELRKWNPAFNSNPDSVKSLPGWRHLIDAGFSVTIMDELITKMKQKA